MKTKHFTLMSVLLLSVSCVTFADRLLDRTEILQIFKQLTDQPKKTWIPAGTIQAVHEEYRAPKTTDTNEINNQINKETTEYQKNSNKRELTEDTQKMKLDAIPFNVRHKLSNEYTMNSSVIVKFDGERFYWEINVDSRVDSVKPDKNLAENFMTDQFDLNWNARRIFAWDGEKYTTYFLPGNHAIIDSTGKTPHNVNGPLTAGLIPWGYGYYTYENLSAAESSAVEKQADGQTQIQLTLNNSDGSQMLFVLDPQKNYAVLSCIINKFGNMVNSRQYSNYQQISNNWIPFTVLIEGYKPETNKLLTRDLWDITSIDANIPQSYEFNVSYKADALIEHSVFNKHKPEMYRYSQTTDTTLLLAKRLEYAVNEETQKQNCATAALKYVVSQFGKDITDQQLAELVNEPNQETNLYQIKQFAQSLGLYCRAVKTNIKTLKNLNGCKAILHIPGKKHFVVLETIDDKYVWTIDLASNRFYYRTDIDFFPMDWAEGAALLISNNVIKGEFTEIDESELSNITGASGYQCNVLRQTYNVIFCDYVGGECGGNCTVFYERWGCGVAESGSCSQTKMVRYEKSPCIEDPYYPFACTVTGEWTVYYMQACA
ncbi:MAG: cysteine peptidase family C39 domain-containing protein [Sedimentisphaerales bacterium]